MSERQNQSTLTPGQALRLRPVRNTMIAKLDAAHIALMDAADTAARRYGVGTHIATQLAGAAAMIAQDWIPSVIQEQDNG